MIKALIIDDERNAFEYLNALVKKHLPEITETFTTSSLDDAREYILLQKPALLFLDVEMPLQSGFDFLLTLKEKDFDVIFTTAFSEYAIQAIRFSAIDFLLKPIQPDELKEAFQRFLNHSKEWERRHKLYEHLFENLQSKNETSFKLSLTRGRRQYFISPGEIYYCKADDNYTQLFLKDETFFILARTLKEVDEMLSPFGFIRSHKSSLVNKFYIDHLTQEGMLILKNQMQVEVSRRRMEEVKRLLRNNG